MPPLFCTPVLNTYTWTIPWEIKTQTRFYPSTVSSTRRVYPRCIPIRYVANSKSLFSFAAACASCSHGMPFCPYRSRPLHHPSAKSTTRAGSWHPSPTPRPRRTKSIRIIRDTGPRCEQFLCYSSHIILINALLSVGSQNTPLHSTLAFHFQPDRHHFCRYFQVCGSSRVAMWLLPTYLLLVT